MESRWEFCTVCVGVCVFGGQPGGSRVQSVDSLRRKGGVFKYRDFEGIIMTSQRNSKKIFSLKRMLQVSFLSTTRKCSCQGWGQSIFTTPWNLKSPVEFYFSFWRSLELHHLTGRGEKNHSLKVQLVPVNVKPRWVVKGKKNQSCGTIFSCKYEDQIRPTYKATKEHWTKWIFF